MVLFSVIVSANVLSLIVVGDAAFEIISGPYLARLTTTFPVIVGLETAAPKFGIPIRLRAATRISRAEAATLDLFK